MSPNLGPLATLAYELINIGIQVSVFTCLPINKVQYNKSKTVPSTHFFSILNSNVPGKVIESQLQALFYLAKCLIACFLSVVPLPLHAIKFRSITAGR